MYFRTKTVKGTALVQLVESYRNAEGQPRQRVVASLGDASVPEMEKPRIARAVENHLSGNRDLLGTGLSEEAAAWVARILQLLGRSKSARPVVAEKVDGVLIDRIATENVVELGPQLVALAAWNELGLSDALDQSGLNASQIATAQLLVAISANRIILDGLGMAVRRTPCCLIHPPPLPQRISFIATELRVVRFVAPGMSKTVGPAATIFARVVVLPTSG